MIVLLTALPLEYEAVREHMVDVRVRRHGAGTLFDVGALASHPGRTIALAATGIGNLTAAALTERAVVEFKPAAMMFVGIAGALRDRLDLGDVVVGTRVYAYQGGRSEDEQFLARPRAWDIAHSIEQMAGRISRSDDWFRARPHADRSPAPQVHFGPIAAGDILLDSRTSATALQIRHHYNDAVAVEMESAGFALAGHLNNGVPTATIRAVSDHADGRKHEVDSTGSQRNAARNAAAFAVALAAALDDGVRLDDAADGETSSNTPQYSNTNIARDHAHVDRQVGFVFGNLGFDTSRNGEAP